MNVGRVCARNACTRAASRAPCRLHLRRASDTPTPSTPIRHDAHHSVPSRRPFPFNLQYGSRCFASMSNNGGKSEVDDGTEDWIPPDDSPLAASSSNFYQEMTEKPGIDGASPMMEITPVSSDDLPTDGEIEIIDLEATVSNQKNAEYLKSNNNLEEISPEEFGVESNDVEWKDILRELRDNGETDMMNRLVKEYSLQSHLDSLDNDIIDVGNRSSDRSSISKSKEYTDVDDDVDWDTEFEASLEGLPDEEIIDELIENSFELSEMEMDILGQGISEEREGNDDDLDLEYSDWAHNDAYREFRKMVLDDYKERKQARDEEMQLLREIEEESKKEVMHTPATTKAYTKLEYEAHPQDWKDYDSNSAFQRDFLDGDDSWEPPTNAFIPSRRSEEGQFRQKESDASANANDLDNKIDWLQARRSRIGDDDDKSKKRPTHMMTPEEAERFSHKNSQIPVIPYTLLTTDEISTSLTAQGGTDIHIIDTAEFDAMNGVGIGCNFILLVTARNSSHTRVLADSIVRNLKARKLSERGVMGAMQGPEGGTDVFTNKRSRNRASRKGGVSTSGKLDDDWMVVDCENIHVHIMEESTRECLNIESLWDLSNPDSEGSVLRSIDFNDEDAVDEYVAKNPIPDAYAAKIFGQSETSSRMGAWVTGGVNGRVQTISAHNTRKSFSEKWSGVSKTQRKKRRGQR